MRHIYANIRCFSVVKFVCHLFFRFEIRSKSFDMFYRISFSSSFSTMIDEKLMIKLILLNRYANNRQREKKHTLSNDIHKTATSE